MTVTLEKLPESLASAAAFTLLGLAFFGLAYFVITKAAPFSVRKEIEDDQNTALAILIGSVILGMSIIIAAAIHG
jgi:putative membrane protein